MTAKQLNLFATGITCSICHQDPGAADNTTLWNGFKDKDLNVFVCWSCRQLHYQQKAKTKFAHHYTEFPVMNPVVMNNFLNQVKK